VREDAGPQRSQHPHRFISHHSLIQIAIAGPQRRLFWAKFAYRDGTPGALYSGQEADMDSGYYAACTTLVSRMQALDTIANNLANASTPGYRAEHNLFSSVLADSTNAGASSFDQAVNTFGIMSGTMLDTSQGALQKTGNDLDVAIQGSGYFVIQTAKGEMYTRDGAFQVSATGQLVTAAGDAVMGDKGTITIPPGRISISSDGTISSKGAISGKLKVVDFVRGTQLQSVGGTYYSAPAKSDTPSVGSTVQQGSLENSNVNPILSVVQLITAQRAADQGQRVLTMFSSEMDKTAAQELPKVS
jgi:flagellar basal-body rod protein FlgF/flagellar basal-body rod protein FlgG